jgi:hypothetical protein
MPTKIFSALFFMGIATLAWPQASVDNNRLVRLDGSIAQLVIQKDGGAIVSFYFKDQELNPLTWSEKTETGDTRWQGHFLCLDRWGAPSAAEERNGMPFHGEASRVEWQVTVPPQARDHVISCEMAAVLPLAGMEVKRKVRLSEEGALFSVREEVTNTRKLGRIYNMVQHPTIAPPFLDENTVVDSNARKGLMGDRPLPNFEEPAVYWPQALKEGQPVNLRFLTNDPEPNVVSFTLDDEYGWITACNPPKGLLIGYIWKSSEYQWLVAWRHVKDGHPAARGLEFGTNGIPHPDSVLVAKGKIFGRQTFQHLDAGETAAKSYAGFLFKIPKDYRGVASIDYSDGRLTLHERPVPIEPDSGRQRDLVLQTGDLFAK